MRTKYRIIRNYDELDRLINLCLTTGIACVDFETNGEKIHNKDFKPTILSVTCQPGFGCSIPLWHPETKDYTGKGWSPRRALKRFSRKVIENRQVCKVAWNAKFDFAIFQLFGYFYRGTLLDGMLAKYLLNEEKPNDLKAMVARYIPEAEGYEADKGFDKIPWDKKPLEQLCKYGCQDADYTLRLTIFFENKLFSTGLYSLYRNMIMAASRVLQTVEFNGLYLDRAFNKKLLEEYEPKIQHALETCLNLPKVQKFKRWFNEQKIEKYIESIEKELKELDPNDPKDARKIASREQKIANVRAGIFTNKKERELVRDINLNSNVDLPALMFSKEGFNMKPLKQTSSGRPSTDEESLVELRLKVKNPESPKAIFLDSLLELRGLEKMYKTYILGWSEKVQDDDCLHGRFQIQGTTSGRLSSAEPNMQQVPKTSVDPNIKKQLIARPNQLYLAMDFSQAELRIMAHLSGDETYLKAFAEGQDPHLAIAAKKYGLSYEEALTIYEDEDHPDNSSLVSWNGQPQAEPRTKTGISSNN